MNPFKIYDERTKIEFCRPSKAGAVCRCCVATMAATATARHYEVALTTARDAERNSKRELEALRLRISELEKGARNG